METKKHIIQARTYETTHSAKVACSKCGKILISSHEGILGDNNIVFCDYCYKSLLFPHVSECYMEITD